MSRQVVSKSSEISNAWAPRLSESLCNEFMEVAPEEKYSTFSDIWCPFPSHIAHRHESQMSLERTRRKFNRSGWNQTSSSQYHPVDGLLTPNSYENLVIMKYPSHFLPGCEAREEGPLGSHNPFPSNVSGIVEKNKNIPGGESLKEV